MIILVCCVHNFMLQNYIASVVSFVYKLQRYIPKLQILLFVVENKGRNRKILFLGIYSCLPFFLCQASDYNVVGFFDQLFDFLVWYVLVKINADPVFFIHVPSGFYARVRGS